MADYDLNRNELPGGGLLGSGGGNSWLGNLFNFSGGRSTTADLYGDLFTPKQLAAIQQRESQAKFKGLLDAINQAAAPSEFKKNFGQILGAAGSAMLGAEGGDKAAIAALGGQKTAAQIAQLRAEMEAQAAARKIGLAAYNKMYGAGGAPAPTVQPPAPPPGEPTRPPPGPTPNAPLPNPAGAPVNPFAPPPIPYAGPGSAPASRPFGMFPGAPVPGPTPPPDASPGAMPGGGDPGAGAGMPPVDPQSQYAMMMSGGLLGAGGGGPQLPPTEGEGDTLPPPDTVIPGGPGLLNPDAMMLTGFSGGSGERPIDIIARLESGNRNIMQQIVGPRGGYNPSVGRVTGPSSAGGPHQIIDPTWQAAAKAIGVDTQKYPKAILAPRPIQDDVAQHLYDTEGYKPWAPYNKALAREVGWKGAQYTEGSGGGSGPGGGGAAAPATGTISDIIPGLNMSAAELAMVGSIFEQAKIANPFKPFLDAYYKTPGYQEQSAGAAARGRIAEEEPLQRRMKYLDMMIGMRQNGIIYDPKTNTVSTDPTYDRLIGRREEEKQEIVLKFQKELQTFQEGIKIEEEKRGETREIGKEGRADKPVTIYGPEGRMIDTTLPAAERDRRLREQSMRPGEYRPGDIVNKPTANLSPDMEYRVTPQGTFEPAPIPNTPAARAAADVAKKDQLQQQYKQLASDTVVSRADRIEHLMDTGVLPTTGVGGSLLARMGVGNANDIATMLTTIESNVAAQSINQMRQMSPTGAALGNTSDRDVEIFKTQIANVRQASSEAQFRFELREMKRQYLALIHGPEKAAELMSVKPPPPSDLVTGTPIDRATYDKLPSGSVYTAPDGKRKVKP